MNTPLRRVAIAVMLMIVALLMNATYVQVIKADDYRTDPRNSRVLLDEYSRQRGQISAGGTVLANSVATEDRYKYLRTYPNTPEAYSPVTGFYSMQYGSNGLERAEDSVLNGSDSHLFGSRLVDMVSGRDPRGGNVLTTIDPAMQQVAYDELTSKGYTGSVVAIEPSTGKILTMVSTPSYDPNQLSGHDGARGTQAWEALSADPRQPMLNRAVSQTYPPGSTFKVVVTAAALANNIATPEDQFTAAPNITLPGTATPLENYNGTNCGSARPPRCTRRSGCPATPRSPNSASRWVPPGSRTRRRASASASAAASRSRWPRAPSARSRTTPRWRRAASVSVTWR